ncbi:MAG: hypothetical protein AAFR38_11655 [Planctomycetota bacterium]
MPASYRALCSDFYVNQKLGVKLDLPRGREAMLDLFERMKRAFPGMSSLRRYKDELALESSQSEAPHRWLAIRPANLRSGVVNPTDAQEAYGLHRSVLELAPFFLSISPLDIEYLELLFGFDFAAGGNQDELVASALLRGSPLERLFATHDAEAIDFQPVMGFFLLDGVDDEVGLPFNPEADAEEIAASGMELHLELKTRSGPGKSPENRGDPISVYVTLRKYEPVADVKALPGVLDTMIERAHAVIDERVVPNLLAPLRETLAAGDL